MGGGLIHACGRSFKKQPSLATARLILTNNHEAACYVGQEERSEKNMFYRSCAESSSYIDPVLRNDCLLHTSPELRALRAHDHRHATGDLPTCVLACTTWSRSCSSAASSWCGWTEQMKFGDGTSYSWPVQESRPVARLKWKTPMRSESWFAVTSHWPEPSNWKCLGVAPRVCWMQATERRPLSAPLWWTRKTEMLSWPRLETKT